MMASKARLFGDDTALSAILATKDPREQNRLGRHVRLFDPELWRSECEHIVLHGNLAKFSQNEEMHLALIQTSDRRLAEASPHDSLWGIGLSARDPRASSPDSWCGQNLLGQALENAREILRRDIPVPLSNPTPETPVHCAAGDTVFEVDPVTHLRLVTNPLPANTQSAMLFASTASVPDDHAPEVLLAQEQRIDAPLIPEQGPYLIGGVVIMDDATFTTLLSLHSGVSATSRFNCRAHLETGSPQSFIHQRAFDQMVALGAADASCVRSTTPRTWSGFGSRQLLSTNQQARMTVQFFHNGTTSASLAVWMYIVPNETCDALSFLVEIVGCVFPPAPIKPFRRTQTVAPSVNSPSHHAKITSAAPLPTSATARLQTMLTTSSTTAFVCPSPTPRSLLR